MTLLQPALLTDGGTHPSALVRRFQKSVVLGNEGIDFGGDLKVRQTATASTSILIGPGGAFVNGKVSALQGTYYVSNPDDQTVANAVPSVGTVQHYLVVLRVADPAFEGTADPNLNMNSVQVVSTTIGGRTLPAGTTGIVLARLEVPADTTTVTAAMIVDLRQMANPRRQRVLRSIFVPVSPVDALGAAAGTREFWPDVASFGVDVPTWAARMIVVVMMTGVSTRTGSTNGNTRVLLGTAATQDVPFNEDWAGSTQRRLFVTGGTVTITSAMRGSTQTLRTDAVRHDTGGTLEANGGTTVFFDYEFVEGVV